MSCLTCSTLPVWLRLCNARSLARHWQTHLPARLWIEETKELDVFETEISWNWKGLVAIAIATAVRKKSLAAAAAAIWFSETPPCRERALDRCSRIETPPPCSGFKHVAKGLVRFLHALWLSIVAFCSHYEKTRRERYFVRIKRHRKVSEKICIVH